jgi:hypothetical protein
MDIILTHPTLINVGAFIDAHTAHALKTIGFLENVWPASSGRICIYVEPRSPKKGSQADFITPNPSDWLIERPLGF